MAATVEVIVSINDKLIEVKTFCDEIRCKPEQRVSKLSEILNHDGALIVTALRYFLETLRTSREDERDVILVRSAYKSIVDLLLRRKERTQQKMPYDDMHFAKRAITWLRVSKNFDKVVKKLREIHAEIDPNLLEVPSRTVKEILAIERKKVSLEETKKMYNFQDLYFLSLTYDKENFNVYFKSFIEYYAPQDSFFFFEMFMFAEHRNIINYWRGLHEKALSTIPKLKLQVNTHPDKFDMVLALDITYKEVLEKLGFKENSCCAYCLEKLQHSYNSICFVQGCHHFFCQFCLTRMMERNA